MNWKGLGSDHGLSDVLFKPLHAVTEEDENPLRIADLWAKT
jgi:hypothetical protein